MKYLFTNQKFHKSKLPLFREFSFLKFKYLIGPNILQLIFQCITYSIVADIETPLTCPE